MAPKRRRKTGLTRMDAALDQLTCFGFSRPFIRQTVKNLLKLYGEDGWKLIEEDSYKVVLDVILDEQETAQTQNLLMDASTQQDNTGSELVMAESSEVPALNASSEGNNNASLQICTGLENKECCKDITMDATAHSSPSHDDHSTNKIDTQCSENTPHSGPASDVAPIHAPVNVPARRRKPCYGWISDDDDDDEETYFIRLTPAR